MGFRNEVINPIGFFAQSDALSLGITSTTSTSFVDIGNGTTTGFPTYTVSVPIAGTYRVDVDLALYQSVSAGGANNMTLQLANTTTSNNYSTSSMIVEPILGQLNRVHFSVWVDMVAGNNTLKLQWKVLSGATWNTDSNSFRTYTVTSAFSQIGTIIPPPTWANVTYQNGYVDFSSGYSSSSYFKNAMGIVRVRLAAKSGTAAAVIFALPAGYRPAGKLILPAYVDGATVLANQIITVLTNGNVAAENGGGTTDVFSNFSFLSE
jgi:hypothetical protein